MNVMTQGDMTISDLIEKVTDHFEESEELNLEALRDEIAELNFDAIEELIDYDSESYCKTLLHQDDLFEITLICWLPHQQTPFHSHPDNGCLMKILKGRLNEKKNLGIEDKGRVLIKNDVTYMDGGGMHTITNLQDRSISLHIYSPSGFYD